MIEAPGPDPHGWPEAGEWLPRARRLGSLRWSDLGPLEVPEPEPVEELAAWLADAADRWWDAAGRPDPFTLVVASADDGTLAARVLGLGPACLTSLRYVLVRPLPVPAAMAARLALEEPAFLFPVSVAEDPEEEAPPAAWAGPLVTCLPDIPAVPGEGAVVALRTVGRLPSERVELREGTWWELRLAALGDRLVEIPSRLGGQPAVPGEPGPGRYAVLSGALEWLRQTLSTEMRGRVAVIDDWTATTVALQPGRVPPLALDQLARLRRPEAPGPAPVAGGLSVVSWRVNPVG